MQLTLTVTAGPHKGRVFTFSGHDTFIVGRSQKTHFSLPAKDGYFSRFHFMVEINPPLCRLVDMESRNGTRVNGEKVATADLKDGDCIQAGRTIIQVALEGAPAPVAVPPVQLKAGSNKPAPLTPAPAAVTAPREKTADQSATARSCRACDGGELLADGEKSALQFLCAECRQQAQTCPQPIKGFRFVRELGKGGMGVVHLVLRETDGAALALKSLVAAVTPSQEDTARFLREAEILRELDHPHIVAFRDMGESNNRFFFAMDYVRGTDAARLLKQQGPLPVARAVGLTCQLLDALAYAHGKKFVHRDIKPANVLIAEQAGKDHLSLADFGLARTYQASTISGLTVTGSTAGTPEFMPPEQILSFRNVAPPTDQYAAAGVLYMLLTGKFIFDFPAKVHLKLLMIMQSNPVPIQSRRADLPPALAEAIHRGLAREPADRFADVQAFRKELLKFC